ncbi:hypothetical protein C2857_000141 [Epichloe festucae Fl1]|uniref:Uncharacterized protein n=1 Tax=Epichloe festucae (strain Fl1) TaxID=877507 RepID=A0A7S9PTE3_EPIFF|nr:hypothetical protein C2857_000141 [Epichloe festucae Fl1]
MSDGQICRNLLGNPANFWLSELQADLRLEDGYTVGAEFNTARRPGREGSYHRTDRCVWRVDPEHLTLTVDIILEAKAPKNMSDQEHIAQAFRDAEEIVRTHQYEKLHVITTRSTAFHAWLYTNGQPRMKSLFSEQFYGQHLDAIVPQASEEWFHFIYSVKTRPNILKIHPTQVLRSQVSAATADSSDLVEEGIDNYVQPSQPEFDSQAAMQVDDEENTEDTYQNTLPQLQAQTVAGACGTGRCSDRDWVDVTNKIRRVRHRIARDELIFENSQGSAVVTVEEEWSRHRDLGRHARVWKKTRYFVTRLP